MFSGLCWPFSFHVSSLGHRLLSFLLFVSIFSTFSCFWCICLTSSGLPLGLIPCCSSSASFLRHQLHVLSCISFYPILVFSPPPAFLGSLGFRFCCGVCFFLQFRLWLHIFFTLLSSLFHMLQFGLLLAVFLSVFPHAVATVDCFILPPRFSAYCSFGCLFLFLLPFSVCCDSSCSFWSLSRFFGILRLRLLFAFGMSPVVFRAAGSPSAVPRLSGCCFPCVSASFLS